MGKFFIYQSDERMFFLNRALADTPVDDDVYIYAPNVLINAKLLENISEHSVVIGGKADEDASAIFKSRNIKFFNMMADEVFQAENAELTAEGALQAIIEHSLLSLSDMRVLVIGFGRTGAAVVRILDRLQVSVDVASAASVRPARAFAKRVVPSKGFDFSEYDVIVNTAPAKIISEQELLTAKQGAVYIELASKPAINMEYARYLGIDAEIYPALPAKTSPVSAAKAMERYITEVLKK